MLLDTGQIITDKKMTIFKNDYNLNHRITCFKDGYLKIEKKEGNIRLCHNHVFRHIIHRKMIYDVI
jgi:hypothetical protein